MAQEIRWRVLILQAIVALAFAVGAGIAFKEAAFARGYVHDQLAAQKINFPAAGSPGLKPEEFPDLQQYAGQPVDDGVKAKAYANGFIGRHLAKTAGGKTYSEVSAASQADPQNAQLATQVQTLFRGETLRATLLNAWGWWTIGTYTYYAGFVLTLASLGVLGALLFELMIAPRRSHASSRAAAPGTLTPQV